MIDHNFGKPVADKLEELGSVKASTTIEYGFEQHASDEALIGATKENKCLLLTHDKNTINSNRFPPCTHGGIIIFKQKKWTEESVFQSIKKLCLSGMKKHTSHAVTSLYLDRAIIETHDETSIEVRF
jgi:hypothetical protein